MSHRPLGVVHHIGLQRPRLLVFHLAAFKGGPSGKTTKPQSHEKKIVTEFDNTIS